MVPSQAIFPLRSTRIRDSTPAPPGSAGVSVCLYVCTSYMGPRPRSLRVPQVFLLHMCFRVRACGMCEFAYMGVQSSCIYIPRIHTNIHTKNYTCIQIRAHVA
jgi:hypothetical protein